MKLPTPEFGDALSWVERHLGHLAGDEPHASARFRGGQAAADAALESFDVSGYSGSRNEVWPEHRRGASGLSPYVRHGLLTLSRVWDHVASGPSRDVTKFRDELLWQEYARHLYARIGRATGDWLRKRVVADRSWPHDPWWREMACIDMVVSELLRDGWMVNQTRMWLASQWAIRAGADWRVGEDAFFRHLLDGSRAANRAGWQWTIGAATGKPYGFSRWQVQKRAPGMCAECPLSDRCPVEQWPDDPDLTSVSEPIGLRSDPDLAATSGPSEPVIRGDAEWVWLTAESLGDEDPALRAHPDLPVVFVFDEPLLRSLRLSFKRLVFLAETLADLDGRRVVEIRLGDVVEELGDRRTAVTFAPVPGFRRLEPMIVPAMIHPWPWLRRPVSGSVASYSRWRKALGH